MDQHDAILSRLLDLHTKPIDLSLGRTERLLEAMGRPDLRLPPTIHVAGTNGKGSTIALQRLRDARLPYIVVLTNPTTGGVTASYAMLGDVQIAEPGAIIGFAGARVIEQTIREKLPEGFQRAEYLRDHGMVDMVVPRQEMRDTLARLCSLLTKAPPRAAA